MRGFLLGHTSLCRMAEGVADGPAELATAAVAETAAAAADAAHHVEDAAEHATNAAAAAGDAAFSASEAHEAVGALSHVTEQALADLEGRMDARFSELGAGIASLADRVASLEDDEPEPEPEPAEPESPESEAAQIAEAEPTAETEQPSAPAKRRFRRL